MSLEINISRDASRLGNDNAAEFFNEVRNGSAEEGDYPYPYVVEVNGEAFIGFDSGLPSSREPWYAGFIEFDRDSVLTADGLVPAGEKDAAVVNSLLDDFVNLGSVDPVLAAAATDGGSCSMDDSGEDDEDDLGDLFE